MTNKSDILKNTRMLLFKKSFLLVFVQLINLIIPLITLPFILNQIGLSNFGVIAYFTSINAFLLVFSDYGYNLKAITNIDSSDLDKINFRFNLILRVKLILLLFSFIVGFIFSFLTMKSEIHLFFIIFFGTVFSTLNIEWLLNLKNKLTYFVLTNFILRCLGVIMLFVFLDAKEDYWIVPLINSVTSFLFFSVMFIYSFKIIKIKFIRVTANNLLLEFKSGFDYFSSNITITLYNSGILILGNFVDESILGTYSVIDKLIKIIKTTFSQLNKAIIPILNKLSALEIRSYILKYSCFLLTISFVSYIIVVLNKTFLIDFLNMNNNNLTTNLFLLMFITPILIAISNPLSNVYLIKIKKDKMYRNIILLFGITGFLVNLYSTSNFGVYGLIIGQISIEGVLCIVFINKFIKIKN